MQTSSEDHHGSGVPKVKPLQRIHGTDYYEKQRLTFGLSSNPYRRKVIASNSVCSFPTVIFSVRWRDELECTLEQIQYVYSSAFRTECFHRGVFSLHRTCAVFPVSVTDDFKLYQYHRNESQML